MTALTRRFISFSMWPSPSRSFGTLFPLALFAWIVRWWIPVAVAMSMSKAGTIIRSAPQKPLIVFLHGSGDTGAGAEAWIQSLVPPQIYREYDWIFPTANPIPYNLSGGMVSSVWYNRVGGFAPTYPEQTATVEASTDRILKIIRDEVETNGRDPSSIVLGGFSMGGAMVYQTAVRWQAACASESGAVGHSLGGLFALSCYLNDDSKVWSLLQENPEVINTWPPTFVAHGDSDDFILPQWNMATVKRFKKLETWAPIFYQSYSDVRHEMTAQELAEVLAFVEQHLENSNRNRNDEAIEKAATGRSEL